MASLSQVKNIKAKYQILAKILKNIKAKYSPKWPTMSIALWGSWQMGSKLVNFDQIFLCGYWPKSFKILHRAPQTPKKKHKKQQYLTQIFDK